MSASGAATNTTDSYTFSYAHGTVMVFAWMIFAPIGILMARYGRLLHIGPRRKILGDTLWFQTHRLALSLAAVATLLGFFLILVQTQSSWVDPDTDGRLLYSHSILGVLIVCFAMLQVWMALFRCHPATRFRFIYNWAHRTIGILAFLLSVPTIFIIAYWLPFYHNGLVIILSLWTAWVVIVVILFEFLQHRSKRLRKTSINFPGPHEITDEVSGPNHQRNEDIASKDEEEDMENNTINNVKLILLGVHVVISIGLAIPLIILIWKQS